MSMLSETSKTVLNATLAFSPVVSQLTFTHPSHLPVYVQVGPPVVISDYVNWVVCSGAFDEQTTTFAYGVPLSSRAAEVHIFTNTAATGEPPVFVPTATLSLDGSTDAIAVFARLSSNGLVCAAAMINYSDTGHTRDLAPEPIFDADAKPDLRCSHTGEHA